MSLKNILLIGLSFIVSLSVSAKDAAKSSKSSDSAKTVAPAQEESKLYSFTVKNAKDEDVKLSDYKNKVLLIVNVASKCGFTYQYEGLEKLYAKYKGNDFVILAFPSNQFHAQEPGTNAEIQQFCKLTYGVDFPVFGKVDVNGDNAIPLYKWLTGLEKFSGPITWNFNKFLVNKKGEVVKRFDSKVKPEEVDEDVKALVK
ncbi:MAG: glutathione peroxidase [Pseudobdellovibrio sp.]